MIARGEILHQELAVTAGAGRALTTIRRRLQVNGIVQGVGFRPFVHNLARRLDLNGWVRNTAGGVELELQGSEDNLDAFLAQLESDSPPLAHILSVDTWPLTPEPEGTPGLTIRPSDGLSGLADQSARTLISPDVATCSQCLQELSDPADRRYRHPFTNCTHCGPRFTIIQGLPYDRPLTTMAAFPLCAACAGEYGDFDDRRFHAQPIACPGCGPALWLENSGGDPLAAAAHLLNAGKLIAIKGLGGFHLACRADIAPAVRRLRAAKARPFKPLAVMVTDVTMARQFCTVSAAEERLLSTTTAPLVLLQKRAAGDDRHFGEWLAPQNDCVAVMLPFTPLHHLLLRMIGAPLVMTSGNRRGRPLCIDNDEAQAQLAALCDGFLLHNRPIARRCDDSVCFVADLGDSALIQPVRRSRGYAPLPVLLPAEVALQTPLAAAGADLKNVSAVAAGRHVFLTQHIGNLDNPDVRSEQRRTIADFEQLFNVRPQTLVCDLHPDYASSRYARQRAQAEGLALIEVQHHHAHIAGCLAEHNHSGPAIGVCFDGAGYGADGRIWGGEVLLANLRDFQRLFHLEYLPLPGGDAAVRRPYRTAIAYLLTLCPQIDIERLFPDVPAHKMALLETMLTRQLNTPLTSSMGRLFDAVSAILGLCHEATFEAQAAIALEAAARQGQAHGRYYFRLEQGQIRLGRLLSQIASDRLNGAAPANIARRFHYTIADMALALAHAVRDGKQSPPFAASDGDSDMPVALSGGVWQNRLLLELTVPRLRQAGFEVLLHQQVPANDGGLAYGQAAVAAARLRTP